MTRKIKIVRTETLIYDPVDADMDFYRERGAENIDQCASIDLTALDEKEFELGDITSSDDIETTMTATIVEVDGRSNILNERPVNETDGERDYDLFPETDEEAQDEEDDEPVGTNDSEL